jgi:intracellular sulfur oxidation DsrE/DsrF family protein
MNNCKKIVSAITLLMIIGMAGMAQTNVALCQNKKQKVIIEKSYEERLKAENPVKHLVVLQLSSNDTMVWKMVMNNIKNLETAWGDSVRIEVVTFGPGIELMMSSKTTQQHNIAMLKKAGVQFAVCENSMRGKNIPKEAMMAEAGFVPNGVEEIVLKQEQGWCYLKAGY